MRVRNRSGESVEVSYDKIKERIQQLCSRGSGERRADDGLNNDTNYGENDNDKTDDYGENSHGQVDMSSIDIDEVVIETIKGLYDGITTAQLDDMSARVCVSLQSNDHAYDTLAGRICMSNIHKTIGCVMSLPHDTYAPFSAKVSYIGRKMPGSYNSAFFSFVEKYGKKYRCDDGLRDGLQLQLFLGKDDGNGIPDASR